MKQLKKNYLLLFIAVSLILASCQEKGFTTGIQEIDNETTFSKKVEFQDHKDSVYNKYEVFYNKSTEDSTYLVGTNNLNSYTLRARGWSFKQKRVGDWYYEKILNNQKVVLDSIINYVSICDTNPRNTVKKFKENRLDRSKGYFYDIDMKKNIHVGDTLLINLKFSYDTLAYRQVAQELYIFKPDSFDNFCNASQFVLDSFPIIENSARMRLVMEEEDKGKNLYLGYYYLVPKKQVSHERTSALQVFTEIKFEVK